jgi:prolyl-tRNA editing enzyme YbaK/EbsC (Cys-tRNA(Pro) deacylase)
VPVKSALDVHRALLAADVHHEVVRLPSRLVTADDLPRVLAVDRGCVTVRCYVVQRRVGRSFAAVLVPSGRVPSPTALLAALAARSVSPAPPDEVNAVTDFAAGLVSPVCLPDGVEVLADAALGESDVCWCALGEGGVALGVRTRDLLVVTGARVASLTAAGSVGEQPQDPAAVPYDPWTGRPEQVARQGSDVL